MQIAFTDAVMLDLYQINWYARLDNSIQFFVVLLSAKGIYIFLKPVFN